MIKNMYTVYDKKTQYHLPPYLGTNEAEAMREIQKLFAGNSRTLFSQFPEDFDLYEVGTFDDSTAYVTRHEPPKLITNLAKLLENPNEGQPNCMA